MCCLKYYIQVNIDNTYLTEYLIFFIFSRLFNIKKCKAFFCVVSHSVVSRLENVLCFYVLEKNGAHIYCNKNIYQNIPCIFMHFVSPDKVASMNKHASIILLCFFRPFGLRIKNRSIFASWENSYPGVDHHKL